MDASLIHVPQAAIELAKRFEGFRAQGETRDAGFSRSLCLSGWVLDDWLRPSLRTRSPTYHAEGGRRLSDAGPRQSVDCYAALLPGVDHRARIPAGGHRGLHIQPRSRATADFDASQTGQSAGLDGRGTRTPPMGLWQRTHTTRVGRTA